MRTLITGITGSVERRRVENPRDDAMEVSICHQRKPDHVSGGPSR